MKVGTELKFQRKASSSITVFVARYYVRIVSYAVIISSVVVVMVVTVVTCMLYSFHFSGIPRNFVRVGGFNKLS